MSAGANPYAAFGGGTIEPPKTPDPYAAFGGASIQNDNTVNVGTQTGAFSNDSGVPVNLVTGEGGMEAATHASMQRIGAAAEKMEGVARLGLPTEKDWAPSSIADEKAFHNQIETPVRGNALMSTQSLANDPNLPANQKFMAQDAEKIPDIAAAASFLTPEANAAFADTVMDLGRGGVTMAQKLKALARKVVLDPVTKEPTLTPTSIATRALRTQKEIDDLAHEAKAQQLMNRAYEQEKLDQAHATRLKEIEDARQKELAAMEKLKEQNAQAIQRRGAQQSVLDKKNAPKQIVTPDRATARVGSEGRGATWKTEDIYKMIQNPDVDLATKREAISQLVLRGKELPPNARYIMGDATHGPSTYNPRNVTKFTPEGTPLKQGGTRLTEVSKEKE